MNEWRADEIAEVAASRELKVAFAHPDGHRGEAATLWVVGVDGSLYLRAGEGPDEPWFRSARERGRARIEAAGVVKDVAFGAVDRDLHDRIDAAYRRKYLGSARAVFLITSAAARAATLELLAI